MDPTPDCHYMMTRTRLLTVALHLLLVQVILILCVNIEFVLSTRNNNSMVVSGEEIEECLDDQVEENICESPSSVVLLSLCNSVVETISLPLSGSPAVYLHTGPSTRQPSGWMMPLRI